MAAELGSLGGAVRLHGPIDFEAELVPWMVTHADLFVSCHRQSDPSCTHGGPSRHGQGDHEVRRSAR